jgi:hypothetical protein
MIIKVKCNQCKKEMMTGFKMILQIGPRGFRQYATCEKCADKLKAKKLEKVNQ